MSRDQCRPERVEVDGEQVDVIVHGSGPMTDEDRKHLGRARPRHPPTRSPHQATGAGAVSRGKPRTGGDGLWKWTPSGIERAEITNNPYRRTCPYCHAAPGEQCTRPVRGGQRRPNRVPHPARTEPERTSQ